MLRVTQFKEPTDTAMFTELLYLYGAQPMAPVLHQALTGSGLSHIFVVKEDDPNAPPVAAGLLNTPEAVAPIGDIRPVAWVVSDMMTNANYRRRGAAMVLLRHMEGVVVRNGGRIMYLFTDADNTPAMRLYEKAGYQRLRDQKDKAVYAKLIME